MKRALAIALVAVLALGVSPSISSAAVKAGAACKKEGQVSKKAGKEYTCIKKGKKLVWSKGITIKTAAPAAAPAPKTSAVPIPSTTPSPTSSIAPTTSPTPTPSTSTLPLTRREKAFAEIKRVYETNPAVNIPVKYIYASDAPKEFGEMVKEVIPVSAKFWSNVFTPQGEFPLILGSPQSIEWVNDQMKLYGHSLSEWTRNKIKEQGSQAGRGDVSSNETSVITYYVIGDQTSRSVVTGNILMMRGFVAHEYVHAVSVSILGDRQEGIPGWSVEGTANYYGHALAALMSDKPIQAMQEVVVSNLRRSYHERGALVPHSLNKDDLFNALVTSEKGGGGDGTTCAEPKILCYTAGELLTEILIADHGHAKFVDWWKASKKKNWEVAFEETFGIQIDKWYEEIAVPYIIEESKTAIPEVKAPVSSSILKQHPPRSPRLFIEPGYKSPEVLKALTDYRSLAGSSTGKPQITFDFGPNVDAGVSADFQKTANKILANFSNNLSSQSTFIIHAGSDRDLNWLFDKISAIDPNFSNEDRTQYRDQLSRNQLLMNTRSYGSKYWIDFLAVPSRLSNYSGNYRLQDFGKLTIQMVQEEVSNKNAKVLPCWARRGQPKFLGAASARVAEAVDFFELRKTQIGDWYQLKSRYNFQEFSSTDWLNFLPKIDGNGNQFCESDDFSESAGWLLSEKQISDFGLKKVIEWWAKGKENSNWRENFRTVFGRDVDSWYRSDAVPYLIDQFDKWIKPNHFKG
jgi:hypothetical protein